MDICHTIGPTIYMTSSDAVLKYIEAARPVLHIKRPKGYWNLETYVIRGLCRRERVEGANRGMTKSCSGMFHVRLSKTTANPFTTAQNISNLRATSIKLHNTSFLILLQVLQHYPAIYS
jgi:hypothetical protein